MTETMGGGSKPQPQLSEMFQKFALAFKSKTFELFSDDPAQDRGGGSSSDPFLLESSEDFIPDQKVIILKPDPAPNLPDPPRTKGSSNSNCGSASARISPLDTQLASGLISSIFATVSSFEASYLQLQASHVPFNEEGIRAADDALVSHLKKLAEFKRYYRELRLNPGSGVEFLIGSCLEAQVEDNQSKLRLLGFISDRLQAEIDCKDSEVSALRKQLGELNESNSRLSKRLLLLSNDRSNNGVDNNWSGLLPSSCEVLLSVKVFGSVLNDACRAMHRFTKVLIGLMRKAGWDLDLAASSVYDGIDYARNRHSRYAFLSYVCLGMFRGFDLKGFGLDEGEGGVSSCNGYHDVNGVEGGNGSSLRQLLEHLSTNHPMELLTRDPGCGFSRFCEKKYQELVHPTMESSIFRDLDCNEVVLNSWRSLSAFYESFVDMANSIWTLHKLALSFDPVVEIFQVERGVDFSIVYMEDVTRKLQLQAKTRLKVGFTVVPGFKIGRTVIQSQVYLSSLKCTE